MPKPRPFQAETISEKCNFWTNRIVPFIFAANVTADNQRSMRRAMDAIEAISAIRFVNRTNEADYVRIQNADVNNSFVGRIGGEQVINIFNWDYQFIMCPELFHCLGIEHEQSRPDRDNFIQINMDNVCVANRFNFNRITNARRYGSYDFESIMHYGNTAFLVMVI